MMKRLRNVLVGIDFSDCSANALREAARIAGLDGARLIALHVLERNFGEELKSHPLLEEVDLLNRTRDRLSAFAEDAAGRECPVTCEVAAGHPFEKLLKAVDTHSADLLVLGTEGLTQDRHTIGVIASLCVRKAPVAVLLVREHQDRPFRRIVACIDFSDNSRRALEQALNIAARDHAALSVLHVLRPISELVADVGAFAQVVSPYPDPDYVSRARENVERFLAPYAAEAIEVPITIDVVEQVGIHGAITDYLREAAADLVVLGTRGRTGVRKLLLGTTAERVLRQVPCSALAVKPEGFAYPA